MGSDSIINVNGVGSPKKPAKPKSVFVVTNMATKTIHGVYLKEPKKELKQDPALSAEMHAIQ